MVLYTYVTPITTNYVQDQYLLKVKLTTWELEEIPDELKDLNNLELHTI